MKKIIFLIGLLYCSINLKAQQLLPGFDREEYLEVLKINAKTAGNVSYNKNIAFPNNYDTLRKITSPITGFDNKYEIWLHNQANIAVVSFRGSTSKTESWLANAYATMLPAKGNIQLVQDKVLNYEITADSNAYLHAGWLISYLYLSQNLYHHIDSLITAGIENFIISGHSQGGALAYICAADLKHQQNNGLLPTNLKIKALCGAAPKPGNLQFAYAYEKLMHKGWAFNVVNTEDWVPEMPLTVQTVNDVNKLSPFAIAKPMIKKLPFPKRMIMNYAYNSIDKPLKKANKSINKTLGKRLNKIILKHQPELICNQNFKYSTNFSRAGEYILLVPDSGYHATFTDTTNVFLHHMAQSYIYLLENELIY